MKRRSTGSTISIKPFWSRGQPTSNTSQQQTSKFGRFSKQFKSHYSNADAPKPRKSFFGGNRNRSASMPTTKPSLSINTEMSASEFSSDTSSMPFASSPVSVTSENKENKISNYSANKTSMDSTQTPVIVAKPPSLLSQAKQQKSSPIKSLPRSFIRSLSRKNDNAPTISLTVDPQISPPSLSYTSNQHDISNNHASFSLTDIESGPGSAPTKPKKQRQNSTRPKSFLLSPSTLANAVFRRNRNRSSSMSGIDLGIGTRGVNNLDGLTIEPETPTLKYESFPDPDPEDFIDVDMWDLPDSLSATEDAGGVLQMIEYDGILINGVVVG